MEEKKIITVKMLENVFGLLIEKLKNEDISEIDITDDYYKIISTDEWKDFDKDADIISVGSLYDDFDCLEKALNNEERFITYVDFDRTASLLRFISEKLNPVNS